MLCSSSLCSEKILKALSSSLVVDKLSSKTWEDAVTFSICFSISLLLSVLFMKCLLKLWILFFMKLAVVMLLPIGVFNS